MSTPGMTTPASNDDATTAGPTDPSTDELAGPTLLVWRELDGFRAADVWPMWTDSERLATWWWAGLPDVRHEVEPRVGGRFAVSSAVADLGAEGRIVEVTEPHRLVMTWRWLTGEGQAADDLVTIELREHTEGTLVLLTHQMSDPEGDPTMRDGWAGAVLGLRAALHAAQEEGDGSAGHAGAAGTSDQGRSEV